MSDEKTRATLIPILDYLWKTYMTNAQDPTGGDKADVGVIMSEMGKLKTREAVIDYLRNSSPFKRHLFEDAKKLHKANDDAISALAANDANGISTAYFSVAGLILSLKLWRGASFPFERLERSLTFTPEEKGFLDNFYGFDLQAAPGGPKTTEPVRIYGTRNLDKKELWKEETLVNPDYEESPIRTRIRELIKEKYGVERLGEFGGTNVPLPPGTVIKQKKVPTEVVEINVFTGMSQFLETKYDALRRSTYRPLSNERHESGEYKMRSIKFTVENGEPSENASGKTTAEMYFIDPATLLMKMSADIKLIEQSLLAGAKKIDKDYFFNIFFHLQTNRRDEFAEDAQDDAVSTGQRFEPSETDDRSRHRDRISPSLIANIVTELMAVDQYVFGGHLDLDAYMDSIGIRRKPNILLIEGEGLGCYEYTNNMLVIPALCPHQMTPIDQILAAFADFRYSLWTGSPREIFNEQGVGFPIVGKKKKSLANKPMWSLFPTQSSSLVKQKAFRETYRKHVLSHLFNDGVKSIAGITLPTVNNIVETGLRQYFNVYCPLATREDRAKKQGSRPDVPADAAVSSAAPAAAPAPAQKPAATAAQAPAPIPAAPQAPAPEATAPAPAPRQAPVQKPAPAVAAPVAQPPAPAPPAPPTPTVSAAPSLTCSKCNMALPPNSRFCLECGTPVPPPKPVCASCKTELPAGSRFCNVCGAQQ